MTVEEALYELKFIYFGNEPKKLEALRMAVEALKESAKPHGWWGGKYEAEAVCSVCGEKEEHRH